MRIAAACLALCVATAHAAESDPVAALRSYQSVPAFFRPSVKNYAFANAPLSKEQSSVARELLYRDRCRTLRRTRRAEWEKQSITIGEQTMRFKRRVEGTRPEKGWPLFISLHGGGGTEPAVNDSQWANQHKLYAFENALILAPRAPGNTWDLWHVKGVDELLIRLIEDAVLFDGADPDRVYLMGYSAGGDGVYQLAPRLADRFAAAAMSAGHPNETVPEGLRNLPFALNCGANDAAYDRNKITGEFSKKLDELHERDPEGYVHKYQLHEGMGHWMKLEDQWIVPWMSQFTRDAAPKRVVWKQDDVTRPRMYWLATDRPVERSVVAASIKDNVVQITHAQNADDSLTIFLDDRLVDLDQPIRVDAGGWNFARGELLYQGSVARTIAVLSQTLGNGHDRTSMFDARVVISFARSNGDLHYATKADDFEAMQRQRPTRDEPAVDAMYLAENQVLAHQALAKAAWSRQVPRELYSEYVLPYASVDEARENWRPSMMQRCGSVVDGATSCGDAAMKLNAIIFEKLGVKYHATKRTKPNQCVSESVACGYASCSGLSVILVNACRSVGVPARIVGVADWTAPAGPTFRGGGGNHTWVEIFDGRSWRFLGAAEPGKLDDTWFAKRAADIRPHDRNQRLWATCATPTGEWFPMVWAMNDHTVPAVDVTDYYTHRKTVRVDGPENAKLLIRDGKQLVGYGTPGDFILAGGKTYRVSVEGSPDTRELVVPVD